MFSGGRDNDSSFTTRMRPQGIWGDLFRARFTKATTRLGLARSGVTLDCSQFIKPSPDGQLNLI